MFNVMTCVLCTSNQFLGESVELLLALRLVVMTSTLLI